MTDSLRRPIISEVGESALLVSWGNRVSERINSRAHALASWYRHGQAGEAVDLVPGYSSLLVVFDSLRIDRLEMQRRLQSGIEETARQEAGSAQPGRAHIVPVQYGGEAGPDLEELAADEGCRPGDIIASHTSRAFRVAFVGFLPGFAYMGRLPRRSPVARRATPRLRVPAGSVGLAGYQTGIYPFSSPGGWRIIGRTSLAVWDLGTDPPARFAPGDTVRFVESQYEPLRQDSPPPTPPPARPAFMVEQASGVSLIQDLGRPGYMDLGVGIGGAFDRFAAQRANALVGNDAGAAVLELAMGSPDLRVTRNVTIALDGADFTCRADSAIVPPRLSWFVRAGTLLRFANGSQNTGRRLRAYLAVGGGLDAQVALGSRSTCQPAGFGGFAGRALRNGDALGTGEMRGLPSMMAGHYWLGETNDISLTDKTIELRYVPFRGHQSVTARAGRLFSEYAWVTTEQSDRMGIRLRSQENLRLPVGRRELASFGVVPGAIQLPPGGEPVVLGPDCQTTGGYPLIGVVIKADMPALAQASPGTLLTFRAVTGEEAHAEHRRARAALAGGMALLSR